jgi:steroid delta-isomerase-like uncharacterized protein
MHMATASELLEKWVSTFNDGTPEEFEQYVAPNGVYEELGTGRSLNAQQATAAGKDWRSAFPDAHGTIENQIVAGNQVAAEIVWRGTNTGSMNGMPPTGKAVVVRGAAVLTEEGGKTARLRNYLDVAGLLTQLGVMPTPPQG